MLSASFARRRGATLLLCFRIGIIPLALLFVALFMVKPAYAAGTVTIIDGEYEDPPSTLDVFTDGYIQHHLNYTGSLTIDTFNSTGGGVSDLLIEPGVEITWMSGNTLTLLADANIVVSGTIQHDGPGDGSGGLVLLADADDMDGGDVQLGTGAQPNAIAIGSRHGLTRVDGANVNLQANNTGAGGRFVLLGFHAVNQGEAYTVTGSISVTAQLSITAQAGTAADNYVQVGHGGSNASSDWTPDGSFSGSHTLIAATGNIVFKGGSQPRAYAQVGNGGHHAFGDHSGDHTLTAMHSIAFSGGGFGGSIAYAHAGNGGYKANGTHSGDHILTAHSGDITFSGGDNNRTYAQAGNGGLLANGNMTGTHTISATHNITFSGGTGPDSYVQAGNGGPMYGVVNTNSHGGNHQLYAGDSITFTGGGGDRAYAHAGNGGYNARGDHSGNHTLTAHSGDITFTSGGSNTDDTAYAQAGNGGYDARGDHSGNHTLTAHSGNITFTGGDDVSYAQAGNGGIFAIGNMTGSHTISAMHNIIFSAGSGWSAYAQAGNGGIYATGNHGGNHQLYAGDGITFMGGGEVAYAQVGNGGDDIRGSHSGNHTLTAHSGDITFIGGSYEQAYAQVGNGGDNANGSHIGNHMLTAAGNITFIGGGGEDAYAQAGNGGYNSRDTQSGDHTLIAHNGNITFTGGGGEGAYAHAGNGGFGAVGSHSGNHTLTAHTGSIEFTGSGSETYAQAGNGGMFAGGSQSGDHTLTAGGDISFSSGGSESYAQVGNGGYNSDGTHSGDHTLTAHSGNIAFTGGAGSQAYAQAGNGGTQADGSHSGNHMLTAAGDITFIGGNGSQAYAQAGNGAADLSSSGNRSGDITLLSGQDLIVTGARIGHATSEGMGAITSGNTFIGVSQNDPFPTGIGVIRATHTATFTTSFNSAPLANGQLRFYAPDEAHVLIAADVPMNGELFPGSVPVEQMAGYFFFADGPYIENYSFYISPVADVAVIKTVEPVGNLLPGQPLTYTLAFTNSGYYTATNVVLTDLLPSHLVNINIVSDLDPGVTITQISSEPNLTWQVSDLVPGRGGVVTLMAQVATTLSTDTVITNTAGISATLDLSPTNNMALAVSNVFVPRVSFAPTAYAQFEDSGNVVLTATLDIPNPYAPVTVNYASSDSSANADSDYNAVGGTLTFAPGQSVATLTVPLVADFIEEADENFSVTLSDPVGAALGAAPVATVTVVNDDVTPGMTVSAHANVTLARVGETIVYTYRITNSGALPFTALSAVDESLGAVSLDVSSLGVGEVATGVLSYTVGADDLPGPLVNIVTITATPQVGEDVVMSATISVDLVQAAFAFSKTVGIMGIEPECTEAVNMQVPISTTVVYCYTITNIGSETLTTHTLVDDQLGILLDGALFDVAPGASFRVTQTQTLFASVTNVATWQAGYAGSDNATIDTAGVASIAALPAANTVQATVIISDDDDDQDGDGIPDNIEQAGDLDRDNVPNFLDDDSDGDGRLDRDECPGLPCRDSDGDGTPDFLDPNDVTALDPDAQPAQRRFIFLPAIAGE